MILVISRKEISERAEKRKSRSGNDGERCENLMGFYTLASCVLPHFTPLLCVTGSLTSLTRFCHLCWSAVPNVDWLIHIRPQGCQCAYGLMRAMCIQI